jgi:hypothetical protein
MKKIIISISVFILISSCFSHSPIIAGEHTAPKIKIVITKEQMESSDDIAGLINKEILLAADNARITLPDGTWNVNATINILDKDITLEGSESTHLRFFVKGPGILVKRISNMKRTFIKNLFLSNELSIGNDSTNNGIEISAVVDIENLVINQFYGDGIHIDATSGRTPGADASHSRIQTVEASLCKGDGIYITGGDANVINFYHIDVRDNDGYGINDDSFLGNLFFGCMAHANKKGAYTAMNYNNRSSWFGCYAEGGQPLSRIGGEGTVFGGLWSGGIILEHNAEAYWNGQYFKANYAPPADNSKAPYHEDRNVSYREVQQMIQDAIKNKN